MCALNAALKLIVLNAVVEVSLVTLVFEQVVLIFAFFANLSEAQIVLVIARTFVNVFLLTPLIHCHEVSLALEALCGA